MTHLSPTPDQPVLHATQLTACFGTDRHDQPMAVIDGLPGLGANLSPEQAERLSRQLKQIANDARMGVRGVRHYPESNDEH